MLIVVVYNVGEICVISVGGILVILEMVNYIVFVINIYFEFGFVVDVGWNCGGWVEVKIVFVVV